MQNLKIMCYSIVGLQQPCGIFFLRCFKFLLAPRMVFCIGFNIGWELLTILHIILPSITCWELWKSRNLFINEGIHINPMKVCWIVQMSILSISQAFPFIQMTRRIQSCCIRDWSRIFWTMPTHSYVNLNVDESSLGNSNFLVAKEWSRIHLEIFYLALLYFLGLRQIWRQNLWLCLRVCSFVWSMVYIMYKLKWTSKLATYDAR